MQCNCGYKAFNYMKFYENKRWNVYKCGYAELDKKKNKCDMNICEYISDILTTEKNYENDDFNKKINLNSDEYCKEQLNKFIYLCEITSNFSKYYRRNYISNINFLLNKLNLDVYIEEKESLVNLKKRINENVNEKGKCIKDCKRSNIFPVKLIEYPEYFRIDKNKINKVVKNKPKKKYYMSAFIYKEERKSQCSDINDSDENSDEEYENEGFDMENIESDLESVFSGEGGSFSD